MTGGKTVVKLERELKPPKSWEDAGYVPKGHFRVDEARPDGDEYILIDKRISEPWRLSRNNIANIRQS